MSNNLGATAGAVATIVLMVVSDMAAGNPIPSLERLLDRLVITVTPESVSVLALAAAGYEVGALLAVVAAVLLLPGRGPLDSRLWRLLVLAAAPDKGGLILDLLLWLLLLLYDTCEDIVVTFMTIVFISNVS